MNIERNSNEFFHEKVGSGIVIKNWYKNKYFVIFHPIFLISRSFKENVWRPYEQLISFKKAYWKVASPATRWIRISNCFEWKQQIATTEFIRFEMSLTIVYTRAPKYGIHGCIFINIARTYTRTVSQTENDDKWNGALMHQCLIYYVNFVHYVSSSFDVFRCFFSFAKNRKSAESMKSSDKHLAIIERIQISFNGPGNEANNKSDPLQCDDRQIYRFWLVLFQGRANLHVGDNFTMNSM